MRTLYLDCFSGISGNMFVGMMLQNDISLEGLKETFSRLPVSGYSLICEPVVKQGIQAQYYDVVLDGERAEHEHCCPDEHEYRREHHHEHVHEHPHAHGHHHHVHVHRGLREIKEIIEKADLSAAVKTKSCAVFETLAIAEGKVHGLPPEEVHFHEVGAVDCILDIVGAVWALEESGIEQIGVSPLHTGGGFIQCAHGLMPVPAPATAEILTGLPFYGTAIDGELVTPTGAALVKTLAAYAGPRPEDFVHERIIYGAGTKDLEIPNVLRGYIGEYKMF